MRNQLKAGSILSYLQMAVNIVIGLLYTPVMIRILGKNEYGLYNTVSSAVSMLSILNLGFNSGYIRYYAQYKKTGDRDAIERLNGLFLTIFLIIGTIALACGLFLCRHLDLVFKDGLTEAEYGLARVLMLLLTVNLAVSFPMSVFSNIISAHEEFIFLKMVDMLRTILGPLVTLPLLLMGYRSVAMVTVTVAVSFAVYGTNMWYVLVRMREKFRFRQIEKGIFVSLFAYTSFIAINLIVDQINWHVDKLVIGRFKGTAEVAVYSVGFALYTYYMVFSTSVSGVFTPRIHHLVRTQEDPRVLKEKLTELFIRVGRIQFLLLALLATGIVFFGSYFITGVWVGEGYERSYYVALLLILPASIALIQNLGLEIQRAQNRHQFRSIAYLFMAVINLVMSVYLCQLYGAVGSAVGTAVSLVAANGFAMNIYYHKRCNLDILAFWRSIAGLARGLILPVAAGIAMRLLVPLRSRPAFLLCVLAYAAVYSFSMWRFGMNPYEKQLFLSPLHRLRAKACSILSGRK